MDRRRGVSTKLRCQRWLVAIVLYLYPEERELRSSRQPMVAELMGDIDVAIVEVRLVSRTVGRFTWRPAAHHRSFAAGLSIASQTPKRGS